MSKPLKQQSFDIAIVGASMVGALLAQALCARGYRVALLERQPVPSIQALSNSPPSLMDCNRFVALAAATAVRLGALGVWQPQLFDAEPVTRIRVSQQGRFGATVLDADEQRVAALGYVVENQRFTNHVLKHLQEQESEELAIFAESQVTALENCAEQNAKVLHYDQLGKSCSLRAALVVAADGARSQTARLAGIDSRQTDYQQMAIVSSIRSGRLPSGRAFERFTGQGPLAFLPAGGDVSTVVHCVSNSAASELMAMPDSQYLAALRKQFGASLGRFLELGKRAGYPLLLTESVKPYTDRVLLLGNAARTLHPVAGQGFNLAVRDVTLLLALLEDKRISPDPGSAATLESFAEARKADRKRTVRVTDTLARIFTRHYQPLAFARALGLIGMDSLPPARRMFAEAAMGFADPLPDLDYQPAPRASFK